MDALELRILELEKNVAQLLQFNKDKIPNDNLIKYKKTTHTKSHDDPPKKKRSPSGYLLYINSIRAQVKTDIGQENGPKDVTRELAKRWKALDDEQRTEWNDKSKAIKHCDTD
tara:strand:+ start:97 stop:435 length:339 start_codon:yes stop_codon:yes gene_type:complete